MPNHHHLFAVTHWLLKAATALTVLFAAVLVVGLGALLVAATNLDGNHLGIPANLDGIARSEVLALGAFALLAVLLCVVLVLFAILSTARIIESAISGNPFVNENAKRLARIGWLLLAIEIVGLLTNLTISYIVPENSHIDVGFDMSPVGLLGILLIFVLAQIFRHGSDMRAELEATV